MSLATIEKDICRFWKNVEKRGANECWLWKGYKFTEGYGSTYFYKRCQQAHRISFFLHGGITTKEKPCVLHSCHNKLCVNPKHLRAGDHQDNSDDKVRAGRQATGKRNGNYTHPEAYPKGSQKFFAKLDEKKVAQIRRTYATQDITTRQLASIYGVGKSNIHAIISYKAWRHVL